MSTTDPGRADGTALRAAGVERDGAPWRGGPRHLVPARRARRDSTAARGPEAPTDVAAFLTNIVGFRLTGVFELEGDVVGVWTRGGVADHDVAYMRAVRPDDRLHHIAFSMVDSNHYQALADRLADNGKRFEFGPGRHGGGIFSATGFGSNLFAYAFDPSGNRNEFSGDMKSFADGVVIDVTGRVDEVINVWAKNMPESFMTIGS